MESKRKVGHRLELTHKAPPDSPPQPCPSSSAARTRTNTLDLSKQAREHVLKLDVPGKGHQVGQLSFEAPIYDGVLLTLVVASLESDSTPDQVYQLVQGLIEEDLLLLLAQHLWRLPFESRKDTQVIFSYVFRFRPPTASPKTDPVALSYVVNNKPQVLLELCRGYEHKESATPAGSVLREVLKSEAAAAIILYDDGEEPGSSLKGVTAIERERPQSGSGVFWRFFDWIDKSSFEVAADAFTTFRELLTKHKDLVPRYLAVNFELFFDRYNHVLVQSNSYVTKRQSIKLLGEILLDRSNYNVMTAYVDRGEHLKICMNLLRDDRKMVQYEGFHVFKVFVANPHKSVAVQKILLMNRDKLLNFLSHFLEDRTDDEQFIDEREFLIKQIRNMPPNPVPPTRQMPQGA
ncbi:Mo25-like protein [Apiospora hydei]|uniref:Mo25-like protein n=1 Tax=Apiospora hydei TaxID=1337664 RepID=A0ABR1XCK3_9PEZI